MTKGVSPLIASVLLIAVTMAIAGVMATWATSFTATKISESSAGADCIGALDLSNGMFDGSNVTVRIRNVAERINITGMKLTVEYDDVRSNKEISIKDYNASDPLAPGAATYLIYDTGSAIRPKLIEVRAANCIKYPATLALRP